MTNAQLGTEARPLRVAIIGAGPSGFFAAGALFKANKKKGLVADVDLFDRLPAPYGLVRYGVAPDHPEIKRVQVQYEKTAANPRFRFFGNVDFGRDLTHAEVREHYDMVCYTVSAQTDRKLNIDGEDLDGSFSATEFVAWYNGHPDFKDRTFDLEHENVVVIGAGNVAMDVARILAKSVEELANTDIADHAIAALEASKIRNIYILARRGPVQAKFTTPEIKEFGELDVAHPEVSPDDLDLDPHSASALENERVAKRNLRVLNEYAERDAGDAERRVKFCFLTSPTEILGEDGKVVGVTTVRNRIEPTDTGYLNAVPTDATGKIECGLVLRSVGYRGVALPDVPFDARRGTIPHEDGRVVDPENERAVVAGEYVAGWVKRGPSGVIGTNKGCASKTVNEMIADLESTTAAPVRDPAAIPALLGEKGVRYVTFDDWRRIDAVEIERGAGKRPRVKIVDRDEMLSHLGR